MVLTASSGRGGRGGPDGPGGRDRGAGAGAVGLDDQASGATAPAAGAGSHRRDTIITTAVGLSTYGLSLFTGPLLARSLGTAARGTYTAVWTPTQLIGWLLMLGIPAASMFYARTDNRRQLDNGAWLLTAVIGVPVVALLWPLVPLFLHRHPPMAVMWFRLFLVGMLLVLPMQNTFEYLRGHGHNLKFNIYRSLPIVFSTIGVVSLFVAGRLELRTALFVTLLANVAGPVVVIAVERTYPRFGRGMLDRQLLRLQLHYGARVWVGTLSNLVLARFDQFLMVGIVAPSELGLYAIAVTAAGLSVPVAQGVGYALFPFLRRDTDPVARDERMWEAFRWVLLGSLVICGLLAEVANWAIPALMGADFRGSLPAFFMLLPGQTMWNLGMVFKTRLEADNRPGAGSNALAIAAVITIVGVPTIVPAWGIMGAAVVTTLSQGAFCLASWLFVKRAPQPADGQAEADTTARAEAEGQGSR